MTRITRFIVLMVIILVPVLAFGACGSNDTEAIKDAVNSFYKAWNDRDFERCLELLSSSSGYSENNIEGMSESRENSGELTIKHLEEPFITETTATVSVEVSSKEQDSESIEIQLVQEDGDWKLGGYVISGRPAEEGDTVRVDYTLTLADGTEADSSRDRGPLEFTLGAGQMIPGFEKAVYGMKKGQTKTFTIPPEEAYGFPDDEHLIEVAREELPAGVVLELGTLITITFTDGTRRSVPIVEITETTVTLDANHPLAGEELTFEITFIGVLSQIIPVNTQG